MLANEITLSVDVANNGTPVDQDIRRMEEQVGRTTYVFDNHAVDARDQVQFYRTYAKRSGASRGSSKCSVKFTKDLEVSNADGSGTISLPLIGEVSFSLPVGTEDAEMKALRQRLIALLDDDTIAGPFMSILEI